MQSFWLKFLNKLLQLAGNHRAARRAAGKFILLELAGVRWYSPRWYWRNMVNIAARVWQVIQREIRGFQLPVPHPNPNARICADFICIRHNERPAENERAGQSFSAACEEQCFGMKVEQGIAVSLWQDFDGKPEWLEIGCRDCTEYLRSCKGILPEPVSAVTEFPS